MAETKHEERYGPYMTANNAPAPFAASASQNAWGAFRAFSESLDDDITFTSLAAGAEQWVQIQLDAPIRIWAFSIACRTTVSAKDSGQVPKNFTVQGSADGTTFEDIQAYTDAEWGLFASWDAANNKYDWANVQKIEIACGKEYQYYRFLFGECQSVSTQKAGSMTPTASNTVKPTRIDLFRVEGQKDPGPNNLFYARYLFDDSLEPCEARPVFTVEGTDVIYTEGKYRHCVSLTDYYRLTINEMSEFLNKDFTITFWFLAHSSGLSKNPGYRRIIWASASKYRGIELSSGRIALVMDGSTKTGSTKYNDDQWHFLVWKHEGKNHTITVDGTETITNSCENTFTGSLLISETNYSMNGFVDDLFLFDYLVDDLMLDKIKAGVYSTAFYGKRILFGDSENRLYTISNGVLSQIPSVTLTADAFQTYGIDATETVPDWSLLIAVQNPRVLCWMEDESEVPEITAVVTAFPLPQELAVTADMTHESISGIRLLSANYSGQIGVRYSTDGGTYTEEMSMEGVLATDVAALWESVQPGRMLYMIFVLHGDAALTTFQISYNNYGG